MYIYNRGARYENNAFNFLLKKYNYNLHIPWAHPLQR